MVNGKEGHVAGGGLESSGEIDSFILGGEVVANVISCARKWQKALSFSPGAPKSRRVCLKVSIIGATWPGNGLRKNATAGIITTRSRPLFIACRGCQARLETSGRAWKIELRLMQLWGTFAAVFDTFGPIQGRRNTLPYTISTPFRRCGINGLGKTGKAKGRFKEPPPRSFAIALVRRELATTKFESRASLETRKVHQPTRVTRE